MPPAKPCPVVPDPGDPVPALLPAPPPDPPVNPLFIPPGLDEIALPPPPPPIAVIVVRPDPEIMEFPPLLP